MEARLHVFLKSVRDRSGHSFALSPRYPGSFVHLPLSALVCVVAKGRTLHPPGIKARLPNPTSLTSLTELFLVVKTVSPVHLTSDARSSLHSRRWLRFCWPNCKTVLTPTVLPPSRLHGLWLVHSTFFIFLLCVCFNF